jgi:PDZ domain-containing protein
VSGGDGAPESDSQPPGVASDPGAPHDDGLRGSPDGPGAMGVQPPGIDPEDPGRAGPASSDDAELESPGADQPGSGPAAPPLRPAPRRGWSDRVTIWFGGQPPRTARERARSRAIRRGILLGSAMIVFGSFVKLPLLVESPGPTYNTIGEVDGEPMIVISDTTTYPTEGNLDMTTVSVRGGSTGGVYLGEALVSWALPSGTVVPRESVYGPDVSGDEVEKLNTQLFGLSQSDSIAAAMGELGIPTEESVVVTQVGGGTPADGIVEAGDIIVAVDGTTVSDPAEVGDQVRTHDVGDTVVLDVLRSPGPGQERVPQRLEVVTVANPDSTGSEPTPYVGILVSTQYEAPFPIDFTLANVGGPSAGMMFSLAIVDMLTPGPLTEGGHVAGTGTIDPDGNVGPIGGIRQKLVGARDAGAQLFLAPQDNCDEVSGNEPDGMTVVPVRTLAGARDVVQTWAADPGAPFPTCAAGLQAGGS